MKDIEKLQAKALAVAGLLDIPAHRLYAIEPELKNRVICVAARIWRERDVSDFEIAKAAGIFRMGDFDSDSEDFLLVAVWRAEVLGEVAKSTPASPDHDSAIEA